MSISSDLFMAILAMDSYNRGYNPGLVITGNTIGNATIGLAKGDQEAQAASFFAQAYQLADGNTVISYRGTDQALPSWQDWTFGDVWNGWGVGAGSPVEAQAA